MLNSDNCTPTSATFVTFIVYVLTVPSSAVTLTFTVFSPIKNPVFPVISIVAFVSSAIAPMSSFSTSPPTVKLYSVMSGLNSGSRLYCSTVKELNVFTLDLFSSFSLL